MPHLELALEAPPEALHIALDGRREVGVRAGCVPPGHNAHHGHGLRRQRHVREAQLPGQCAHLLLVLGPPVTMTQGTALPRPPQDPHPASRTHV